MRRLNLIIAFSISASLSGCAMSRYDDFDEQIDDLYGKITAVFDKCMEVSGVKGASKCGLEFLQYHQRAPDTYRKIPFTRYAEKIYRMTLDWESGRIKTSDQWEARERQIRGILETEIEVAARGASEEDRRRFLRGLGAAGKAMQESTRQPPSITCRSNPDGAGGFRTICQ